jgi:hypothetical protein
MKRPDTKAIQTDVRHAKHELSHEARPGSKFEAQLLASRPAMRVVFAADALCDRVEVLEAALRDLRDEVRGIGVYGIDEESIRMSRGSLLSSIDAALEGDK